MCTVKCLLRTYIIIIVYSFLELLEQVYTCKCIYSGKFSLDLQACPFVFDLFTEDNEGEIEIVDLLPSTPHINPALSRLIRERGVCKAVNEGRGQLDTYTFTTPHMTTIVVENKVQSDKECEK